jgi:cell division protein FtsW (lipid II flippase)
MVGEKDLGSSLMFFTLFVVMLWVATERTSFLVMGIGLFVGGAVIAYNLFSHVQTRVEIWLNPWDQYTERGYQPIQALFALANGGMTGTGLGIGDPGAIPAAHNDFIFAALGEEFGLIGGLLLLASLFFLIYRALVIAMQAPTLFSRLLAGSMAMIFFTYAFVNVGMVSGILPVVGVPLPFISYGGTAMVTLGLALGILMSIAKSKQLVQT